MAPDFSRHGPWRLVALCVLLCYPIMVVKWFPFGGGARYLTILAAPISLILLLQTPRGIAKDLLLSAWRWCLPFLPFVLVWVFARMWHGYVPLDLAPLTRLFFCALLFVGARLAGVGYRHLSITAGIAATVYCSVALFEVYGLGRARAWAGTYENRFGQYSIWMAALCCLHLFHAKPQELSRALRAFLLVASALGIVATLLSGSRGSLLAGFALLLIALFRSANRPRSLLITAGMLLAVATFCYLYNPAFARLQLIYREFFDYFTDPKFNPTSIGIRLELFRIAFLSLVEHPVLGPGYTSLKQLYESHPAFGIPLAEVLQIPGFHNDWAQVVGIGGGLLLTALLTSTIWLGISARRNVFHLAFLAFAVAFSFSELFFTDKMGLSLLMASWALYAAAEQNQKTQNNSIKSNT